MSVSVAWFLVQASSSQPRCQRSPCNWAINAYYIIPMMTTIERGAQAEEAMKSKIKK